MNKPPAEKDARVMVYPDPNKLGAIRWATFRFNWQAERYIDQLQAENPTWKIVLRKGTRR